MLVGWLIAVVARVLCGTPFLLKKLPGLWQLAQASCELELPPASSPSPVPFKSCQDLLALLHKMASNSPSKGPRAVPGLATPIATLLGKPTSCHFPFTWSLLNDIVNTW